MTPFILQYYELIKRRDAADKARRLESMNKGMQQFEQQKEEFQKEQALKKGFKEHPDLERLMSALQQLEMMRQKPYAEFPTMGRMRDQGIEDRVIPQDIMAIPNMPNSEGGPRLDPMENLRYGDISKQQMPTFDLGQLMFGKRPGINENIYPGSIYEYIKRLYNNTGGGHIPTPMDKEFSI